MKFEQTGHGPALDNGLLRVAVHLNRGTYEVIDVATGAAVLSDAAASVSMRDGPTYNTRGEELDFSGTLEVSDKQGDGRSLLLARVTDDDDPDVHVILTLYENKPFVVVQAEVQNVSGLAVRVQALRPLDGAKVDVGALASGLRFYKHGWQSWSPTLVLDCAGEDIVMSPPVVGPGTQPPGRTGRFISELMTAVVDPASSRGIVAGFISTADQFTHVWFDREDCALSAVSWADGIDVEPKAVLASERLYIEPTSQPLQATERYGDALAQEMDALSYDHIASGWCSWYQYFTAVSEADVMSNLQQIDAHRRELPFEYVQIDDGYQSEIGDWLTPNDKFPNGMRWLAERIHSKGMQAGLWLAPFLAGARSKLFQEHPDWFVKFSTGTPAIGTVNWGQPCFSLDTTHPEVVAWLKTVFRTICDEWGYDYVKIDFIFAAAVDGVRHDPNVTRAQAYRRGVEIIREAVGNRFILACGNPQGPSVGLVDGARIGPDVAPVWLPENVVAPRSAMSNPSALNSIRNTLTRWWMHGRLWMNDPDCLMVRDADTQLTLDESRSLTTAIGLTGGMVLDSDDFAKVPRERREMISVLLPVYGQPATPVDLFQAGDVPQVLELDCGTHRLLALFNWSDETATVAARVPEGRWHAFEFWGEEYGGVVEGSLAPEIPAHGCKLLRLTAELGRPQVVGSTYHITMGAVEVLREEWDGERLSVEVREMPQSSGRVWAWYPDGVRVVTGLLPG